MSLAIFTAHRVSVQCLHAVVVGKCIAMLWVIECCLSFLLLPLEMGRQNVRFALDIVKICRDLSLDTFVWILCVARSLHGGHGPQSCVVETFAGRGRARNSVENDFVTID